MTELAEFQWIRLRSVPLTAADGPVSLSAQLVAGLTACHAELLAWDGTAPTAFAMAWIRPTPREPMHFLVGGRPILPLRGETTHDRGADSPVLYPPGATGQPQPGGEVERLLNDLPYWTRCLGQADALLMPEPGEQDGRTPRGSFEDYVAHLDGPFAWLVLAEPVPGAALEEERTMLASRITLMRRKENSEQDRLDLQRAQARYRELTRSRAAGMWNVSLLVGAQTDPAVQRSAALLCGATQVGGIPYSVLPTENLASLAETLTVTVTEPDRGASPCPASGELLATMARPPLRELPGIRLVTPLAFDVTPEAPEEGLLLGEVVDAD